MIEMTIATIGRRMKKSAMASYPCAPFASPAAVAPRRSRRASSIVTVSGFTFTPGPDLLQALDHDRARRP